MEKITKEPSFAITVVVVFLIIVGLFIFRVYHQKQTHPAPQFGYEYGTLVTKKSGLSNAETFIALGQEALDENRFDDARTIFSYATTHYPENAKTWLGLSEAYLKEGYKEEAIPPLEQATELIDTNPGLWYRLGSLYFLTSRFEKSQHAFERAVELEPENTNYQLELAKVYNLNHFYEKSLSIYTHLLNKDPNNKELSIAYAKVSSWAKEQPPVNHAAIALNEVEKNMHSNNEYLFQQSLNEYRLLFGETPEYQTVLAEFTYRNYLKKRPQDADIWYELAQFYSSLNKPQEAWSAIQEALKINPVNLDYLELASTMADQLDKREDKLSILEQMLAIYPQSKKNLEAYNALRIDLILTQLEESVPINPEILRANPLLLNAVIHIEQRNFPLAFQILREYAVTEETGDPLFQSVMAMMVTRMTKQDVMTFCTEENFIALTKVLLDIGEEFREDAYACQWAAQEAIMQALCLDPYNIDNLYLYTDALRLLELPPQTEYVLAQRAYALILELDPCDMKALRNLARVTALNSEIDAASDMYEQYVRCVGLAGLDPEVIFEYAGVLEDQGNNALALKYMGFYSCHFDQNQEYFETLQHQLNSADRPSPAFAISTCLLEQDCCSYEAWLNYTRSAALLGYPYASLHGLNQLEKMQPTHPLTIEAQWMTLLPLLSNINFGGLFHQERGTTLSQWNQYLTGALTLWPGMQATFGLSGFETHADTSTAILGLGDLRQVNGKTWAGEFSAWVGFNKFFTRQFNGNFRLGVGHTNAASSLVTVEYGADLTFPICDNLEIDFYTSYGFYNYSPRSLSLFIRRWYNELSIDWYANIDNHILSTWEFDMLTDGNQLYEITVYPRHTILNSYLWKIEVGLMGNWLHARKEVQHGYYAPHLYQGYAAEVLFDYILSDFSVLKINETIGAAKDSFDTNFGVLWDNKVDLLYNFSLYWYLEFHGEYYYQQTTDGIFDYVELSGQLTHRF